MITPGTDLFSAIEALQKSGVSVLCTEVRSKKGVEGGVPRLLRAVRLDSYYELLFSYFKCEPCAEVTHEQGL